MKTTFLITFLFVLVSFPAYGDLSTDDLSKFRQLIQEEINPIKDEISLIKIEINSLKDEIKKTQIDVAWIRGRFEGIEKQFTHSTNVTYGLIALIVAAIGIPQTISAIRSNKDRQQEKVNKELKQEIDELKQNLVEIS